LISQCVQEIRNYVLIGKKLLEDTPPRCSEIQFNFKFWAKLGYRERERE